MKEYVAVIPSKIAGIFKTLDSIDFNALLFLRASYLERDSMEHDPKYVQLIPYVVLKNRGRVLVYERTTKGGDDRLHGRRSIGFGGHINPVDSGKRGYIHPMVANCIARELHEETNISLSKQQIISSIKELCVINENETRVDQVHLGFVYTLDLSDDVADSLELTDPALEIVGWTDQEPEGLENWSKIIFETALREAKAEWRESS